MLGALERAGYVASRAGTPAVGLRAALRDAPPRAPGAPDPAAAWRGVTVAPDLRTVSRPPGVRIDLGGIGKGLAADAAARLLPSAARYAVDCGGDLALGGPEVDERPWTVDVRSPWGGAPTRIRVRAGGVATSGLDVRLWRAPDGTPRHHLLDPATGVPAWTGVIAATALGATAVDAEIDAKAACSRVRRAPSGCSAMSAVPSSWRTRSASGSSASRRRRSRSVPPPGGRMTAAARDPFDYGWWIAARAAGIIAIVLVSASIGLGLAMATRARRRPGMAVALRRTHQYVALTALVAIAAHGVFLLLDPWLHASAGALVVPFRLDYRPVWTGLGVIAGWMTAISGCRTGSETGSAATGGRRSIA